MGAIQQIMLMAKALAGVLDTTAFTAEDNSTPTATAECVFQTDGTATLTGSVSTTPTTPLWWTAGTPPATWMSYSSTGNGTITGGLTAGTRYQLNTPRTIGNSTTTLASRVRTFTVSFYDAATGGNLLGTKTFTATVAVP